MTQAVRTTPSTHDHEQDRRWFHWEAGVQEHYASGARHELLAEGTEYILEPFFFAYGLADSRRLGRDHEKWCIQQMPSDGPALYFGEEAAMDTDRFVAQLKGEEPLAYTPEQLREVATACLDRAKSLIDLAQEIASGRFKFPGQVEASE